MAQACTFVKKEKSRKMADKKDRGGQVDFDNGGNGGDGQGGGGGGGGTQEHCLRVVRKRW